MSDPICDLCQRYRSEDQLTHHDPSGIRFCLDHDDCSAHMDDKRKSVADLMLKIQSLKADCQMQSCARHTLQSELSEAKAEIARLKQDKVEVVNER